MEVRSLSSLTLQICSGYTCEFFVRRRESDDTMLFKLRCVTHMDLLRVALMVPFQTDMYDMFTLLTPLAGTIELKGRMRGRE